METIPAYHMVTRSPRTGGTLSRRRRNGPHPGRPPSTKPTPREIEWRQTLERWRHSGLNGRAFCRREGISENLFYGWKRVIRLRGERRHAHGATQGRAPVHFVPVRIAPSAAAPFEVTLAGGRVIRLATDFDSAALAKLVAVLEGREC